MLCNFKEFLYSFSCFEGDSEKHLWALGQCCEFANLFSCDSKDIQDITRNWIWNHSPDLKLHIFLPMNNWFVSKGCISARLKYSPCVSKNFLSFLHKLIPKIKEFMVVISSWTYWHLVLLSAKTDWWAICFNPPRKGSLQNACWIFSPVSVNINTHEKSICFKIDTICFTYLF